MTFTRTRNAAAGALVFALAACQDTPLEPERAAAGAINMNVAGVATGFVLCGQEIPVTVTVTDGRRKAIRDFHVNFNVLAGGGQMFGGAGLTDRRGVIRDFWTTGNAANVPNTLAVRAVDPSSGERTTYFSRTVTTLSRIAFTVLRDDRTDIYAMYPDGSNEVRLTNRPGFDALPVWSPDGRRIAFVSDRSGDGLDLYAMDADGSNVWRLTFDSATPLDPAWSPDGRTIAFSSVSDGQVEIYVIDSDGGNIRRLTDGGGQSPSWSPDGSRIAFQSTRVEPDEVVTGLPQIHVMNADGSGVQRLTNPPFSSDQPAWSPEGPHIAFTRTTPDDPGDIYVMAANGSNVRRLTDNPATEAQPTWSPDGGRIVFVSTRDGSAQIYAADADGSNETRLTTQPNNLHPAWSGCVR